MCDVWRKRQAAAFVLLLLIVSGTVSAQNDQARSDQRPLWYETLSVNGFLSNGYTYNFNRPDTMKNFYRVFDFDDNTLKIDVLELSVRKDAGVAGDAGFRVDLAMGSSIPRITRSAGLDAGDVDAHQIYISYTAPIGNGLRFDAGKFITPLGYEVIEGYDGFNDQYSRSFLFGYAIPFTHAGVKASYAFHECCSAMLMVVNGWDNVTDNNKAKSIGAQVGIVPVV